MCVGRQDRGGEDLMQEGICVCRTARQGRGGPDAGRLSVCVGWQDRGGEDLMQEGYLCV